MADIANLLNAALIELVNAGAPLAEAATWAVSKLTTAGPTAFDWDITDQSSRDRAVRTTVEATLSLLTSAERACYLDLAATHRGAQIPISVLRLVWSDRERGPIDIEQFRGKLIRLRLVAAGWTDGEPALYLHDILHDYVRHSLPAPQLTSIHRKFIENAKTLVNFAASFYSPDAEAAAPWWALLDDPLYLWLHVPWHLAQAQLTAELRHLLLDPRWLTSKIIRTGSPAFVEIDLELAGEQDISFLRTAIRQSTHLLIANDGYPTLGATLLSRIEHVPALESVRSSFRRVLGEPRLEAHQVFPDIPSEATRRIFTELSTRINSVSISSDGLRIAAGANDGTVRVWNTRNSDQQGSLLLHDHSARVSGVALSADASLVASCSDDNSVAIWTLANDSASIMAKVNTARVTAIAFSPDGTYLALGGQDGSLTRYSIRDRRILDNAPGDGGLINSVVYSPDGLQIVTGALNHKIFVWEHAETGLRSRLLGSHSGPVTGLCFGPDQNCLYSSGWDKVVREWSVPELR